MVGKCHLGQPSSQEWRRKKACKTSYQRGRRHQGRKTNCQEERVAPRKADQLSEHRRHQGGRLAVSAEAIWEKDCTKSGSQLKRQEGGTKGGRLSGRQAAPGEADKLSGIKVTLREADWLSGRNAAPMEEQSSCHGRRRQSSRQANCHVRRRQEGMQANCHGRRRQKGRQANFQGNKLAEGSQARCLGGRQQQRDRAGIFKGSMGGQAPRRKRVIVPARHATWIQPAWHHPLPLALSWNRTVQRDGSG